MKPQKFIATLATGFACASLVRASLKNVKSEVFVKLADLTRPDAVKQGKSVPLQEIGVQTSLGSSSETEGVDWTVHRVNSQADDALDGLNIIPVWTHRDPYDLTGSSQTLLRTKAGDRTHSVVHLPEDRIDESTFTPLNPPSVPLAVKGPYLSAWLPSGSNTNSTPPNFAGNGGYLAGQWPAFWTSSHSADGDFRLGWTGFIRVDNITYQWMGNSFGNIVRAGPNARQVSMTYTSTRSIFEFDADGVKFNVTFTSPIWPNDYFRHSIPLSYMHVVLDRSSAQNRSVQLYTDIDERWATAHDYDYENFPMSVQWIDNANGSSIYFVQRTNPQILTEYRQRAEWGSATYAMRRRKGMSSRNNNNVVTQFEFVMNGKITTEHGPVGGPQNSFAYSVDFDEKGGNDALFAIGHVRTPYVNYIRPTNATNHTGTPSSYLENRYGYWMAKYPNFSDLVAFFLNDYENAAKHCEALDRQIDQDSRDAVGGGDVGMQYSAINQLSVRQSLGALEITVPYDSHTKTYNTSSPIVFLKEISSNGDMQTVDVFTPQFPILTYLNPRWLRDIMEPIFEYTESGLYPNKWCVHDMGVYPSAFGHNDGKDEPMQVEESGNMILLALHYAQLVGSSVAVPWLKKHYDIMKQWAEFLVTDALIPATQLSTDDFAGTLANQTNLAIKGIEGIAAMGEIASMIGKSKDAKEYANISSTYIQAYYGYALSKKGTHVKLAYQDDKSWGTLYNLVFDRLLNLRLVAKDIYTKQDSFYPTKELKYGTSLDSRFTFAKSDWQMWASATAASNDARDYWIKNLFKYLTDRNIDAPFSDLYETRTGDLPKEPFAPRVIFINRPVVGGHFSHLAMQKANKANGVDDYQYGAPIKQSPKADQDAALARIALKRKDGELEAAKSMPKTNAPSLMRQWPGQKPFMIYSDMMRSKARKLIS